MAEKTGNCKVKYKLKVLSCNLLRSHDDQGCKGFALEWQKGTGQEETREKLAAEQTYGRGWIKVLKCKK